MPNIEYILITIIVLVLILPYMMMRLSSRALVGKPAPQLDDVVNSDTDMSKPVFLYFLSKRCSNCREMTPLIEEEGNANLKLRVFVTGGGCSGFQYGFTFDESINDGDTEVENQGVKLLIDPMSFQYLVGAEIDYSEGLEGSQFVIRNPNATTTARLVNPIESSIRIKLSHKPIIKSIRNKLG